MKTADVVQGATPSLSTCASGPSSERWLGLSFRTILPWSIEGLRVEPGTLDDALNFVSLHYAGFFGIDADDSRWLSDPLTPAKRRFLSASDIFLVKDDEELVGIMIGEPTDWRRYYIRTISLLPKYRGRSFVSQLFRHLGNALKTVGVSTLEGDVSPVNVANILTQTKFGAVITGTTHTVRWGSLLHFTFFLDPDADAVFRRQYCAGEMERCKSAIAD